MSVNSLRAVIAACMNSSEISREGGAAFHSCYGVTKLEPNRFVCSCADGTSDGRLDTAGDFAGELSSENRKLYVLSTPGTGYLLQPMQNGRMA